MLLKVLALAISTISTSSTVLMISLAVAISDSGMSIFFSLPSFLNPSTSVSIWPLSTLRSDLGISVISLNPCLPSINPPATRFIAYAWAKFSPNLPSSAVAAYTASGTGLVFGLDNTAPSFFINGDLAVFTIVLPSDTVAPRDVATWAISPTVLPIFAAFLSITSASRSPPSAPVTN